MRKICNKCGKRPVAVNYYKNGLVFYRSKCDHCSRGRTEREPLWKRSGYKKKNICEKCGFTSKFQEQFDVYHIDGNLSNCRFPNLKTICANCQKVITKEIIKWKKGSITPDF